MEQRIDMWKQAPDAFKAVLALETYAKKNVDNTLFELIKIRASMINGCAYCLDMHTTDAPSQSPPGGSRPISARRSERRSS